MHCNTKLKGIGTVLNVYLRSSLETFEAGLVNKIGVMLMITIASLFWIENASIVDTMLERSPSLVSNSLFIRLWYSMSSWFSNDFHDSAALGNDGCNSVPSTNTFDFWSTLISSNTFLVNSPLTEKAQTSSIITLLILEDEGKITDDIPSTFRFDSHCQISKQTTAYGRC